MGYILKELEKNGPVSGKKWQSLANSVVGQASAGPGSEALSNVLISAKEEGWSKDELDYLKETYQARSLSDLGTWYQYMNAKERRLEKQEALDIFKGFLDSLDRSGGQVHQNFKIDALYLFGSFLRPASPDKKYGDVDFMAEWSWTGDPNTPDQEKIMSMNKWFAEEPFGGFISVGMAHYAPGEAKKALKDPPEERKWQMIQVWEDPAMPMRPKNEDRRAWPESKRCWAPLTEEDLSIIHQMKEETCALQNDKNWQDVVLPYVQRVSNQQKSNSGIIKEFNMNKNNNLPNNVLEMPNGDVIEFYHGPNGSMAEEGAMQWTKNNKRQLISGVYYYKNEVVSEFYNEKREVHREEGAARIITNKSGQVVLAEWHEDGNLIAMAKNGALFSGSLCFDSDKIEERCVATNLLGSNLSGVSVIKLKEIKTALSLHEASLRESKNLVDLAIEGCEQSLMKRKKSEHIEKTPSLNSDGWKLK